MRERVSCVLCRTWGTAIHRTCHAVAADPFAAGRIVRNGATRKFHCCSSIGARISISRDEGAPYAGRPASDRPAAPVSGACRAEPRRIMSFRRWRRWIKPFVSMCDPTALLDLVPSQGLLKRPSMDYNEYTYCYGGGRGGWYSSLASSPRPPASSFSPGGNQSVRSLERAGFSPAADFFGRL